MLHKYYSFCPHYAIKFDNTPFPAPAIPSSLGLLLGSSSTPRGPDAARQAPTYVSQCHPILQGVKTPLLLTPHLLSTAGGQFNSQMTLCCKTSSDLCQPVPPYSPRCQDPSPAPANPPSPVHCWGPV